jgi:aspartyl-tRNA(Asn)/glutamyl-tRNA(Gln) amidotransferase subunit A
MPTSPLPAFPLNSIHDPLQMYLADIYTICANLGGIPAINVPSGFNQEQKPFGLQLLAPALQEESLLNLAYHFEQSTAFYKKLPPLEHLI